jgi:hypothetical protein
MIMREILFRAKAAHTIAHEWLYGYVCAAPWEPEGFMIICVIEDGSAGGESAIPETVGQFTGLTDKNGKKIFEGDIIEWNAKEFGREYRELVEWDYKLLGFRQGDWGEWCKVIGNIHDNPELLKEDTYEENSDTV